MKYKAVIFDLDGVICHTDQYHYLSWKQILNELNIYFDKKINNLLRGIGRMESFDIILKTSGKKLSDEEKIFYINKKNNIYIEMLNNMSPDDVSSDVYKTLRILRKNKVKTAIGSSSKNASIILERIKLTNEFDVIVCV